MKDDELEKLIKIKEIIVETSLKMAPPEMGESMKAFFSFRQTITHESDRGCALMSAAFIDDELKSLIEVHLVDNKKAIKSIFDNTGALGTFSSRIDLSFLLGLIPKNIYDDLHLLRKVRNDFAHNSAPITFEKDSISQRIKALKVHEFVNTHKERTIFTRTMSSIVLYILIKKQNAKRFESEEDFSHGDKPNLLGDILKKFGISATDIPR